MIGIEKHYDRAFSVLAATTSDGFSMRIAASFARKAERLIFRVADLHIISFCMTPGT